MFTEATDLAFAGHAARHTDGVHRAGLVKRSLVLELLIIVQAAVVGGCSTDGAAPESGGTATRSTPSGEAKTGTLTGQVQYVGGAAADFPRPVAGGTVTFAGSGRTIAAMSEQGRFSAELDPGLYVVTATSPDYDSGDASCKAVHPVRVSAGEMASVKVFCQVR